MGIKKANYISIGDYLEMEYTSEYKHEYVEGNIFAMSGGTYNHGIICGNIYSALKTSIKDDKLNCIAIGSEVRIHIDKADAIVYPDTMVICGKVEHSKKDKEAVINPKLIVEVLSKSTAGYDRGEKFYKYRQLESFKEYILIEQDKPVIESYYKIDANNWRISSNRKLSDQLVMESLGLKIKLSEIYADVAWEE